MDDFTGVLIAFLSGGALGGLLATAYASSQDRAERFRERMLTAAESFLTGVDAADAAIATLARTASDYNEANAEITNAFEAMGKVYEDDEQLPDHFELLPDVFDTLAAASSTTYDERLDTRLREQLRELRAAAREVEANPEENPARFEANRTMIDAIHSFFPAGARYRAAGREATTSLRALTGNLARLRILFAGRSDEPTDSATVVVYVLSQRMQRIAETTELPGEASSAQQTAEGDQETEPDESETELTQDQVRAIKRFAESVSEIVKRRWL